MRPSFSLSYTIAVIFSLGLLVSAAPRNTTYERPRRGSSHTVRDGQVPFLNTIDLSEGVDTCSFPGNEALQEAISEAIYPEVDSTNGAIECIEAAMLDIFTTLTNFQFDVGNNNWGGVIPFVTSNPDILPSQCNFLVAECWLNMQDANGIESWFDLVKAQESVQAMAQTMANQIITGQTIKACGLPWISNVGWFGGIVCTLEGVYNFGELTPVCPTDSPASGWPSDDIISHCGGSVGPSVYFAVPSS